MRRTHVPLKPRGVGSSRGQKSLERKTAVFPPTRCPRLPDRVVSRLAGPTSSGSQLRDTRERRRRGDPRRHRQHLLSRHGQRRRRGHGHPGRRLARLRDGHHGGRPPPGRPDAGRRHRFDQHQLLRQRRRGHAVRVHGAPQLGPLRVRRRGQPVRRQSHDHGRERGRPRERLSQRRRQQQLARPTEIPGRPGAAVQLRHPRLDADGGGVGRVDGRRPGDRRLGGSRPGRRDGERHRARVPGRRRPPAGRRHGRRQHRLRPGLGQEFRRRQG